MGKLRKVIIVWIISNIYQCNLAQYFLVNKVHSKLNPTLCLGGKTCFSTFSFYRYDKEFIDSKLTIHNTGQLWCIVKLFVFLARFLSTFKSFHLLPVSCRTRHRWYEPVGGHQSGPGGAKVRVHLQSGRCGASHSRSRRHQVGIIDIRFLYPFMTN